MNPPDFIELKDALFNLNKYCTCRCRRPCRRFEYACRALKRLPLFRLYYMTFFSHSSRSIFVLTEKEVFALRFEYPLLVNMYLKQKERNKL